MQPTFVALVVFESQSRRLESLKNEPNLLKRCQKAAVGGRSWAREHYGATSCRVKCCFRGAHIEVWWVDQQLCFLAYMQHIFASCKDAYPVWTNGCGCSSQLTCRHSLLWFALTSHLLIFASTLELSSFAEKPCMFTVCPFFWQPVRNTQHSHVYVHCWSGYAMHSYHSITFSHYLRYNIWCKLEWVTEPNGSRRSLPRIVLFGPDV